MKKKFVTIITHFKPIDLIRLDNLFEKSHIETATTYTGATGAVVMPKIKLKK